MFHKNPFTKDNLKSISTLLGSVFVALGIGSAMDPSASDAAQFVYYGSGLLLFFLKEKGK